VITLNSGNSSVNKQKTESEKEKNGHTLGLTSTNSSTKSSSKSSLIPSEEAHKKFIMLKSAPLNQLSLPNILGQNKTSPKAECKNGQIYGKAFKGVHSSTPRFCFAMYLIASRYFRPPASS